MDNISYLTNLAFRFGPFLFALLFTLYISRWGYNNYNKANLRINPLASDIEKNTLRIYFLGTAIFGMILVVVSIVWWFNFQLNIHVFEGKIVALNEYEKVTSNELYFKPVLLSKIEQNLPQYREENFIVVQNKPFDDNQEFIIFYSKGEGKIEEFKIRYNSQSCERFRIHWDNNVGHNVLVLALSKWYKPFFIDSVYANELPKYIPIEKSEINPVNKNVISLLQSESTDIGQKINLIDQLSVLNNNQLNQYIQTVTNKESMILTLLDLSRHWGLELAYKSKKLINDRFQVNDYLAKKLTSQSQEKTIFVDILFRIEKEQAMKILNSIPQNIRSSSINSIIDDVAGGRKTKVLFPTGSSKGDRYYVQAEWDSKNTAAVTSLTNLFYRELIHNRTYSEELKIMKGKDGKNNKRIVYWYSKEWALYIANKINECGGNASFIRVK